MLDLIVLESLQLVPVIELEPGRFSTQIRQSPSSMYREAPEEWYQYWSDCLADSGIEGLEPLEKGSWLVRTINFDIVNLRKLVESIVLEWGGIDTASDLECKPFLSGGIALLSSACEVLIQPGCCSDLGCIRNWRDASAYRGDEWQMVWSGHPWLSVHYRAPWLVLSGPHESDAPVGRWAVIPEELDHACTVAQGELQRFASELALLLPTLGYRDDPAIMGRKLAGLLE